MKNKKQKLVIIAGPTAVGKSKFAILLAKRINGEIICADSTTVYRGLNIGSAKVKKEEMLGIKHYLIDVADINENYDITRFKKDAEGAISEISAKGKIPIIVGGSGFYIQAVLYDIDFTIPDESNLTPEDIESVAKKYTGIKERGYNTYSSILQGNRKKQYQKSNKSARVL